MLMKHSLRSSSHRYLSCDCHEKDDADSTFSATSRLQTSRACTSMVMSVLIFIRSPLLSSPSTMVVSELRPLTTLAA